MPIHNDELLENDLVLQSAMRALKNYVESNKHIDNINDNTNSIVEINSEIDIINSTIGILQTTIKNNYDNYLKNVINIQKNTECCTINKNSISANKTIIDNNSGNISSLRNDVNGILKIISSNKIDLDTVQEIVDYIQSNRELLQSLNIDSIIGLRDALNGIYGRLTTLENLTASNDPSLKSIQEIVDYIKSDHDYLMNFDFTKIPGLTNTLDSYDNRISGVESAVALSGSKIDSFAAKIDGNANALAILQGKNELARADYKYKTTYVKGYTSFGYKSGVAYNDCHVTDYATDITTRVINVFDKPGAYVCGSFSDTMQYVYGIGASVSGQYNQVSHLDYATVTSKTGTLMPNSGNNGATMFNQKTFSWVVGFEPSSTPTWNKKIKHLYVNDTYTFEDYLSTDDAWPMGRHLTFFNSSTAGYSITGINITAGKSKGNKKDYSIPFATGIAYFVNYPSNSYGEGAISTYFDVAYVSAGNGGNGCMYKINIPTLSYILTTASPGTTNGIAEDNWQAGNEKGYTIGGYISGVQSNRAFRLAFRTESMIELPASGRSKTAGTSSGYASAATI